MQRLLFVVLIVLIALSLTAPTLAQSDTPNAITSAYESALWALTALLVALTTALGVLLRALTGRQRQQDAALRDSIPAELLKPLLVAALLLAQRTDTSQDDAAVRQIVTALGYDPDELQ